jgi:H+/Cl- antiporter ClcA
MILFEKVKQLFKQKFDSINNEKLKRNLLNALPFWVGAIMCGGVAVLYAKIFALAEKGSHYVYEQLGWACFIITPICFVIAWWIVTKYAPFARGSGIPQVTAAIELSNPKHTYKVNSLLSLRVIVVKIISSCIMIFGGGAVGREGPTIQISASIFKIINDVLPNWYPKISKRNMIVTGAASGLAAAFNTPLGGIVFAIEELTKTHFSFFKSALLTGVIIAGLTALMFLGPYLYLGYPQLDTIPAWIIFLIIPVAIVAAIAGIFTWKSILYILKKKKAFKKKFQHVAYVAFCGLLVATLAYFFDHRVLGSGKETMISSLFSDHKSTELQVPILRLVSPIISFSTSAAGGIFAPALSAGASIGAYTAGLFSLTNSETNLLILCGMTGFLTSVTKSPFTSSIIVLEMTNSHNVIFYIMLTALCSNLITSLFARHSFYDYLKDDYIVEIHKSTEQEPTTTSG